MAVRVRSNSIKRLEHLISVLPAHFKSSESGLQHVTWSGNAIRDAIASCYKRPADVHQIEFVGAIAAASGRVVRKRTLDEAEFSKALDAEIIRVRRRVKNKYTDWWRINFAPAKGVKIKYFDHELKVAVNLPRKLEGWIETGEVGLFRNCGILYASGLYRGVLPAGTDLSRALERFVSYLNFSHGTTSGIVFPDSARAAFRLGPTFPAFNHAKGSYEETHWLNTNFEVDRWDFGGDKQKKFDASRKEIRWLMRQRRRNPLIEDVAECAVHLNNSWMESETQRSLTSVWNGFERLLSTGADASRGTYDIIAKRAAKFDTDSLTREILTHSRAAHRNQAVHGQTGPGQEWEGAELYRESSRYLTWLLRWAMYNGWRFESKHEFLEWVDIPKEREKLLNRRRLHNLAFTFWHSKKT